MHTYCIIFVEQTVYNSYEHTGGLGMAPTNSQSIVQRSHYHQNGRQHVSHHDDVSMYPPAQSTLPYQKLSHGSKSHSGSHQYQSYMQRNEEYKQLVQPAQHFPNGYMPQSSNHGAIQSSSERQNKSKALSDHKIPANSPILFELSMEVKEWKFLARYLDLQENLIEEIDQYTVPNKLRDKALRVFKEWINTASNPTWKALGEALLEAEYVLLHENLMRLVKAYAL